MIAILANAEDGPARALARRWEAHEAELLTPADLSMPGWRYVPGNPDAGIAVIGGRRVPVSELEGVITRLGYIDPDSLDGLMPSERPYAAAEMNAFLIGWLSELRCRVINRPRPTCLNGPGWSPEQWQVAASRAGIRTTHRQLRFAKGAPRRNAQRITRSVTVAAGICLGGSPGLQSLARRLAAHCDVECLVVCFGGRQGDPSFVNAHTWLDFADTAVADALLGRLRSVNAAVA
jgi:hypothetical protein